MRPVHKRIQTRVRVKRALTALIVASLLSALAYRLHTTTPTACRADVVPRWCVD